MQLEGKHLAVNLYLEDVHTYEHQIMVQAYPKRIQTIQINATTPNTKKRMLNPQCTKIIRIPIMKSHF